jgi:uncharacterized membrane protein
MNRKPAIIIFLSVCILLSILLIIKAITPLVSGTVFAIALVILGGSSKVSRSRVNNLSNN